MKIKRYKKLNRYLGFFVNNYGFRQPYQILIDGTFCFSALNNKINIADNIPRYLQGEVKLLTTQCAIMEMENLGAKLNGALIILKQYSVHKCGHEGKAISGADCMISMVGKNNTNHYIIATQDRNLQNRAACAPGVPILYLHDKTPVLQPPSEVSVTTAKGRLNGVSNHEKIALEELKVRSGIVDTEIIPKKKKKKGPNPLSCKKKSKKPVIQTCVASKVTGTKVEKKKRKKIRIPKHVRDELMKN